MTPLPRTPLANVNRRDSLELLRSVPKSARDHDGQPVRATPTPKRADKYLLSSGARRECPSAQPSESVVLSPASPYHSSVLLSGARRLPSCQTPAKSQTPSTPPVARRNEQLTLSLTPSLTRARRVITESDADAAAFTKEAKEEEGDAQGSSVRLVPVRATGTMREILGSDKMLTPVRRSVRTQGDDDEMSNVLSLLKKANYAYAPNEALSDSSDIKGDKKQQLRTTRRRNE